MSPAVAHEIWTVPREWVGERCFIICGGESINQQLPVIPKLKGRIIAVKHAVLARPDADVMFITSEPWDSLPLLPHFRGTYVISRRGKDVDKFPPYVRWITRTKDHGHLCDLPSHVAGYDAGTSAINLAYHFGATEIILLGYDMTGGRWFTNGKGPIRWPHPLPNIPDSHFVRHTKPLKEFAKDAKRKGIRIVNCSPISRVDAFEQQPLEKFL